MKHIVEVGRLGVGWVVEGGWKPRHQSEGQVETKISQITVTMEKSVEIQNTECLQTIAL